MTVSRSAPTDVRRRPDRLVPSVRRIGDLPIWVLRTPAVRTPNCLVIEGRDGLVMVNTGTSHQSGAALRKAVTALTDRPLVTIIYPHYPSADCLGTTGVTDVDSTRSGRVVVLAAGCRAGRSVRGVPPNLLINRECLLRLSGVTMRLFPAGTDEVGGINIYLPRQRVAILADQSCMWKQARGRPPRPAPATPFVRAVNWFLRFPVEHLLGSHMLPLSGPEVHLVLNAYLNRRQEAP